MKTIFMTILMVLLITACKNEEEKENRFRGFFIHVPSVKATYHTYIDDDGVSYKYALENITNEESMSRTLGLYYDTKEGIKNKLIFSCSINKEEEKDVSCNLSTYECVFKEEA